MFSFCDSSFCLCLLDVISVWCENETQSAIRINWIYHLNFVCLHKIADNSSLSGRIWHFINENMGFSLQIENWDSISPWIVDLKKGKTKDCWTGAFNCRKTWRNKRKEKEILISRISIEVQIDVWESVKAGTTILCVLFVFYGWKFWISDRIISAKKTSWGVICRDPVEIPCGG